jgi:hypothetical protein
MKCWNSINIAILVLLGYKQLKDGQAVWIRSAQAAYSVGAVGYAVWTLFLIVAIPILFH